MKTDEEDRLHCYRVAFWIDQGMTVAKAREMAEFSYYDKLIRLPTAGGQAAKRPMTCPPLMVTLALHYHTCLNDYADGTAHGSSQAVQEFKKRLADLKLLEWTQDRGHGLGPGYKGTEALGVWVAAICATPFPVQRWVIPKEDE